MSIKRFKDFSINESTDYSGVRPANESDNEYYLNYTKAIVSEIENLTDKKIKKISGISGETDMEYKIEFEDKTSASIKYNFHPYREDLTIYYTDEFGKSDSRSSEKNSDLFNDKGGDNINKRVAILIEDMLPKEEEYDEPTHYITLPDSNFDTEGFYYDFKNHPTDGGEILFDSEEDAKKWLDSLKIKKIGE
jgi:hypothetical protein